MNKYLLNTIWAAVIILGLSAYPLCIYLFEMQEIPALIITIITMVVLLSGTMVITLRNQKEEELKSRIKIIKKYLLILGTIIISVIVFYTGKYFIKTNERADLEKKDLLLTDHLNNSWWILNNLEMTNETLWYNEDKSHRGYLKLTEFNFSLQNNSPIDIFSFPIVLEIYDNENSPLRFQKEFIVYCDILANSSKNIKHKFRYNEFDMIPEGFIWVYHTEGNVIPSNQYIRNKSYNEIKNYVISDSASLRSHIKIDWEGLAKDLKELEKNKESKQK